MEPRVTVLGADTLAATLDDAADALKDMEATGEAGALIASASRSVTPVLTGRLAASISSDDSANVSTVTANAGVYAGVQHWGWAGHNIAASLFLLRTAYDKESVWVDYFTREAEDILSHVRGI